jgi:hypothetical protein
MRRIEVAEMRFLRSVAGYRLKDNEIRVEHCGFKPKS